MTNSSTALHFEEDNDGKLISATPCSCLPSPPSLSGLEVKSIKMECSGNTRSSYEVECSDKVCHTDSWPTCGENTQEGITSSQNITWNLHRDCNEVYIDYLDKNVDCGKDGWKTGTVSTRVGRGVYRTEVENVTCGDCNEDVFQWSTWAIFGNKKTRTRGNRNILDSLEKEEKSFCPDGWSKFDLSCYRLVYKRLTWSRAEGYCNELGGHLASVHSSEENDFIFGLVDKQKVWIGANDLNTEGFWVWSDGSAFD